MRQDRVIFNGENPFNEFAKCKELTVLLGENKFMFVATLNSISIMATFNSIVKVSEVEGESIREAYTVPLSLILPLFKLDTKTKENSLTLETTSEKVTITYNDIKVDTDIYAPNGLTIHQINEINIGNSMQVEPAPFIQMIDIFGTSQDNFCNVDGKTLFISDESKCLINNTDFDYQKKFSISVQFIRMMKSMNCVKLYIGDNIVAETKSGLWVVTSLTKITDPNVLKDYKFAAKMKSDSIYTLTLNKYLKQINLAVQSSELSATLDLDKRQLALSSINNERTTLKLTDNEVQKEGEFSFFDMEETKSSAIILTDSRLIKSLASFGKVKIKVCPTFLLAKLGETHRLLFTLGRA